jgi:hypothetical protein
LVFFQTRPSTSFTLCCRNPEPCPGEAGFHEHLAMAAKNACERRVRKLGNELVMRAGGFSLLTDNQNYPLLADDLARRVRSTLNLPVGVIQQFPVTALDHLYVNPAGSPRKRVASPRAGSENQGLFNRYLT